MTNSAMFPVMHVGATDASVIDGNEDFVGCGNRRDGSFGELDFVGFVEDEGEVLPSRISVMPYGLTQEWGGLTVVCFGGKLDIEMSCWLTDCEVVGSGAALLFWAIFGSRRIDCVMV